MLPVSQGLPCADTDATMQVTMDFAPSSSPSAGPRCPSCRQPMDVHRLASNAGAALELDICYGCQGLWFDHQESLRLAPQAVVELFRMLHEHRTVRHQPMQSELRCPHCVKVLGRGFDVVRSGRYITYRCPQRHGRFSPFSSFMVEKGFVRHMTPVEVGQLAERVGAIYCTSCGAPVDIRKEHACPYCRAPFSLIDPEAVRKALEGYAQIKAAPQEATRLDLADALVSLERDRARAEREKQQRAFTRRDDDDSTVAGDLVAAGVALVCALLSS